MSVSSARRVALTPGNIQEIAATSADFIRRGYAVVFPTDTIYGLAVNAVDKASVDRFFALKRRPSGKPVPIFVRDIAMAKEVAFIDARQEAILEKLWPGAFTLVLKKKDSISERLSAGTDTIGLRIPNHTFCQALLAKLEGPITASSANISGMEATADPDEIIAQFKEHSMVPDFFVDAGVLENTTPSTVIDITGEKAKILRMSATTPAMMRAILDAGIS
ncbi:MAG: L-threonylcarbamoyladenylate synthase [Candidatus Spechtbacterales bacterium]